MIKLLKNLFRFGKSKTQKEIDAIKRELSASRKEVLILSNLVGALAEKVDRLAKAIHYELNIMPLTYPQFYK